MNRGTWMLPVAAMPLTLALFVYLFAKKGSRMSVVYYRIAENRDTYWDWVCLPVTSLNQVYAFLHFNHQDINIDKTVVIGSSDSAKLTYYLKNHILGEGPCVVVSAKEFMATRQFNVQLEEQRMNSWVVGEAEKYLEAIQRNPNLERDEQRVRNRLEFMRYLVDQGKFAKDLISKHSDTP